MDSNSRNILASMRTMAWERAKGELRSMLETYYGDMDRFQAMEKALEDFIKDVEDNALQE